MVKGNNTFCSVYGTMYLQVCRMYSSVPCLSEMTQEDIIFYYKGLESELIKVGNES